MLTRLSVLLKVRPVPHVLDLTFRSLMTDQHFVQNPLSLKSGQGPLGFTLTITLTTLNHRSYKVASPHPFLPMRRGGMDWKMYSRALCGSGDCPLKSLQIGPQLQFPVGWSVKSKGHMVRIASFV